MDGGRVAALGLRRGAHLENITVNRRELRNARAELGLEGLRDRQVLLQPMPGNITSYSRQALHVPNCVMEYEIREIQSMNNGCAPA